MCTKLIGCEKEIIECLVAIYSQRSEQFTSNIKMWPLRFASICAVIIFAESAYERIGYFWQITDLHFEPHFSINGDPRKGCVRPDNDGGSRSSRKPAGRFGDYSCDAPWALIKSAAETMYSRQGDNVEFVLWTGDALSHSARRSSEIQQLELLQNLTDLLAQTFSSQFIFPALGHDDPLARKELGRMWIRWLPTDSITTFDSGGYYLIERKTHKLQIVVLNTNLMKRNDNDEEARKQWDWLNIVLQKCQNNKETVYLVGHMPPGSDERQRGGNHHAHYAYTDHHNKRYLKLVRKFADIIVGQFFGHLHSDSFRVIYNDNGRPVSWAMIAPSVTPRRTTDGANNPGLRLYKFDKDTGQVLDYTQYYLDLGRLSRHPGVIDWEVEYNFSSYYGLSNISPLSLHTLAEKLTQSSTNEKPSFNKYYKANSVRMYSSSTTSCDNCAHTHYCAITRVDYEEYEQCVKTAASALASSSLGHKNVLYAVVLLFSLVLSLLPMLTN